MITSIIEIGAIVVASAGIGAFIMSMLLDTDAGLKDLDNAYDAVQEALRKSKEIYSIGYATGYDEGFVAGCTENKKEKV